MGDQYYVDEYDEEPDMDELMGYMSPDEGDGDLAGFERPEMNVDFSTAVVVSNLPQVRLQWEPPLHAYLHLYRFVHCLNFLDWSRMLVPILSTTQVHMYSKMSSHFSKLKLRRRRTSKAWLLCTSVHRKTTAVA